MTNTEQQLAATNQAVQRCSKQNTSDVQWTLPKQSPHDLDNESLAALIRFFKLLDAWDKETTRNA